MPLCGELKKCKLKKKKPNLPENDSLSWSWLLYIGVFEFLLFVYLHSVLRLSDGDSNLI